jgi:hypothetical protein
VETNSKKVSIVSSWPTCHNVKELCILLGLAGYFRKCVKHFGIISQPLTNLLKKNIMFIWTSDHELAFVTLKKALVPAPVLALANFDKPYIIDIDASGANIGAVLVLS